MVCALLPRKHWSVVDLLRWLEDTQVRNERAKCSHTKRRACGALVPYQARAA